MKTNNMELRRNTHDERYLAEQREKDEERLSSLDASPCSAKLVTVTRVYNNGDRVRSLLLPEVADKELEYSKRMRPGCALFRDGVCEQVGYLGVTRCEEISSELLS